MSPAGPMIARSLFIACLFFTASSPLAASGAPSEPQLRILADYPDGDWDQQPPLGPMSSHGIAYDAQRDLVWIVSVENDLWAFSLGEDSTQTLTWNVPTEGAKPTAWYGHRVVLDSARDRLLLWGSNSNQVWEISLSGTPTWAPLAAVGTPPTPRSNCMFELDAVHDRLLVFGGSDGTFPSRDDAWSLSLSDPPTWTQLTTSGPAPLGRWGHSGAYDPATNRLIIAGGRQQLGPSSSDFVAMTDTWALDLGAL